MNNKFLLVIAAVLIFIGVTQPDFNNINIFAPTPVIVDDNKVSVEKPTDATVLELCKKVTASLKNGSSDRKYDAPRLASLYSDMNVLIQLDGEDETISNTEAVRAANILAGKMLRMNLEDKYPWLGTSCSEVITNSIGLKNLKLDPELRIKAAASFRYLAWAMMEGAK